MASTQNETNRIENRKLTSEKDDNVISAVHDPMGLLGDCIKTESINHEVVEGQNKEVEPQIQADIKREGHCTEYMKTTDENGKHVDKTCSVTSFSTEQNKGKSDQFEDTGKYVCDHCSMQFVYKRSIARHIRHHFKFVMPFVCQFCKIYFSQHTLLRSHNQRFHLKRKYECPDCNECFESVWKVQKHTIKVHKLTVRHCIPCEKIFKQAEYKQHETFHAAERNTCSVCNKQFNHKHKLIRHMDVHKRDYEFPCEVCMKAFKSPLDLKCHQLKRHRPCVVKTEKNFACHVCGKLFKNNMCLTQHLKIHDSEKRFMCDKCDKKFTLKHQLNNHMKSHSEVRNHVCDTCGAKFKMPHHLRNHVKTHFNNIQ